MVDLSPKHCEVILHLALLPLYLLLHTVYVLLLVSQQKDHIVGEDIRLIHHVGKMGNMAVPHLRPRMGHIRFVECRRDIVVCL